MGPRTWLVPVCMCLLFRQVMFERSLQQLGLQIGVAAIRLHAVRDTSLFATLAHHGLTSGLILAYYRLAAATTAGGGGWWLTPDTAVDDIPPIDPKVTHVQARPPAMLPNTVLQCARHDAAGDRLGLAP